MSYTDLGQCWREDLEIPNLRELSHALYKEIKPMYTLLHGVARFFLRKRYGDLVPEKGLIPAHLLGDLWSQNWEPLADLITEKTIDLEASINELKWTVIKMIKMAEDFYRSLGLPDLPDSFWEKSVFSRRTYESARCHGMAADMYKQDDYRLLYCSETSPDDFRIIHHELGHIQYYMAYAHQPTLFRQANSALHESIGDAVMYGVMTPQHLHRLRLINDSMLYTTGNDTRDDNVVDDQDGIVSEDFGMNTDITNTSSDIILLLKQALNKIPQIPFAILIEEYRWRFFEGDIKVHSLNSDFWIMASKLQGISPPEERDEKYFDIGARFHVPDNTPYIRYFLSSFLQHQLFESLCKAAVFGRRDISEALPSTIPLNRCDIYGSKTAGRLLKDLMSRGHSQHWREILQSTTGKDHVSVLPIKRYYRPLYKFLSKLVRKYHIPMGW
ncbi:angiotensin-converting enzyme-like [Hyposmocoma kahamanoa]|uniref:angiotensin-converting enzyme-like n=1 Tax=Hyposmocoma kahamanoa TaxID=1477025 RepID=UPI000E6D66C8|nr:angiotensin-converting enzyme-like [Hyposmocoma kahamanoa]